MAHHFTPGTGMFVHTPSWHRLEKKVLADWPGSWEEARAEAGLLWEPESVPVYELENPHLQSAEAAVVDGYQRIIRDDNRLTLGIQSTGYRMVTNAEFGYVIESVLGQDIFGVPLKYEGLFELYEGRRVHALVYLDEPYFVLGDPSPTYRYASFSTRHDGNGGLRCLLTNVRVQCANTAKLSEMGAAEEETAFTIRHTSNWDERVAEVREKLSEALLANQAYYELCDQLAVAKLTPNAMTRAIKRYLPIGDDMSVRQQRNRENEREQVRMILSGPTIPDEHKNSAYGFLQAATEWSDHYRAYKKADTYVTRQLTSKEPFKVKAFSIAKHFAGVK